MKKALAFLLVSLLVVGLCMPTYAVTAQYKSTQAFIEKLDEVGLKYSLSSPDEDGDELVKINNKDDNGFEYTIRLYFDENEENCFIRVWNIIHYSDFYFSKVLRVCNSLNYKYRYLRFYADESDNTVTASIDLIFRDNDVGEIAMEAVVTTASILEKAYPSLEIYDD